MVKSVFRAVRILEALGRAGKMSVSDLARSLELPKSTVHDILSTLEQDGLVERDPERVLFRPGLRLFQLGQLAQENIEVRKVAVPFLRELNRRLDETVHLTVLDGSEVLYVECFESTKRLRTYSVIGVRAPLYCTAVGKAILAYLDDGRVDRILAESGMAPFTGNTITDREKLLENLAEVRMRGYSVDDCEHEQGVRCVGAPIRNHRGEVFASLSVSGPSQRVTPERIPEISVSVTETAAGISSKLGYDPDSRSQTRADAAGRRG